jgi:uncharacterized membrane protein YbaN (DUF454 family)
MLVAIAAIGVVMPGLPTTVFLIGATWCFARSCPWLEERLVRIPLFRPFLSFLEPGAGMPRRARHAALAMMWTAVAISATVALTRDTPQPWIAATFVVAAAVGTWVILRIGRPRTHGARANTSS